MSFQRFQTSTYFLLAFQLVYLLFLYQNCFSLPIFDSFCSSQYLNNCGWPLSGRACFPSISPNKLLTQIKKFFQKSKFFTKSQKTKKLTVLFCIFPLEKRGIVSSLISNNNQLDNNSRLSKIGDMIYIKQDMANLEST